MAFFTPTYFMQHDWPLVEAMDYDDHPFWPLLRSESGRRKRQTRPQDWTQVLDMRRFAPSEIDIQVDGDRVLVSGRHEDVNGENQDSYETKRVLKVPEDVDRENLQTRVTEGRKVVVTAPYIRKEEDRSLVEASGGALVPQPPSTSYQVVDREDGTKEFQLKVHMGDFSDKDLSIRTSDNTVYIDGEKEWEHEGMKGMQKIHRQFAVPGVGEMGEARAFTDDRGNLTVRIPLRCVTQTSVQSVPIQQS